MTTPVQHPPIEEETERRNRERKLDDTLEDSFPASDPLSSDPNPDDHGADEHDGRWRTGPRSRGSETRPADPVSLGKCQDATVGPRRSHQRDARARRLLRSSCLGKLHGNNARL
jgi:hypothetical protein